jgi:hypothetical protein
VAGFSAAARYAAVPGSYHCGGSAAFGQHHPSQDGGYKPWALIVLELAGDLHRRLELIPEQFFSRVTDDFGPACQSVLLKGFVRDP